VIVCLKKFISKHGLKKGKRIAKGWSSFIYECTDSKGKKFALKVEHGKCPRKGMAKREAEFLKLANSFSIGPKLVDFDSEAEAILMEFIDGVPFSEWLFEHNPSRKQLEKFIDLLFKQARALDKAGLDHGQLAGRGTNILVRNRGNKPVIIDFEKASTNRKCHNEKVIESFLFKSPYSAFVKKIRETVKE